MTGRRLHPPEPAAQALGPEAVRSAGHIPVLLDAVLAALAPRDDAVYVDATFGGGGYSEALLKAAHCRVFGIDRDPDAVRRGRDVAEHYGERLRVLEGRFGDMAQLLAPVNPGPIAGIALDLGLSSTQLDTPERGFSFRFDGPLDMRMGGEGPSVADVVNAAGERDLANIIFILGEERFSRGIARAIVKARTEAPIETTDALVKVISSVVRARPNEIHPATRTFQALRIFVNDELGELATALTAAEHVLKPGGRLVVVSFHSLEDRIVKSFLASRAETRGGSRHAPEVQRAAPSFTVLTKRPVTADEDEIARNPRARSAKLRAGERTDAPAHRADVSDLLPRLPSLADVMRGR
jgi:16S rRNA (cytosine1402-N4)-methyltransferase